VAEFDKSSTVWDIVFHSTLGANLPPVLVGWFAIFCSMGEWQ
jgi:hypothetical protein